MLYQLQSVQEQATTITKGGTIMAQGQYYSTTELRDALRQAFPQLSASDVNALIRKARARNRYHGGA